jgi:hypothetical protein
VNEQLVAEGQAPLLSLQVGGTLNPRRHLYIERPDDETLLKLLSEGQYVNVLTSRQMGKSSLMVRTAEVLTKRGVRCAIVDLAAIGTPEDATAHFLGLLNKIARDLKIEIDLKAWWTERTEETMNQRLMRFFREVVLEQVQGPVVCFLDEIDSTLKLPWTDDLFTALRGMHNERPMVPAYERLTFCLIGVAWPNELIKDRRTTPYNVASTLELRDFDLGRDELTPLIDAIGANPEQGRRLIERVLYWTGGHPYLTTRLSASLKEIGAQAPEDVDRRVDDGFRSLERVSSDVHFQQVLRFLETRVANGLATFGLYEKILKGARERDQPAPAHTELKLSGLVKRDDEGYLVVRNRIYERLFDRRWIESTKPKRALAKYRRWAIAASLALLFALGAGGTFYTRTILPEQQRLRILDRLAAQNVTITFAQSGGLQITFPTNASQEAFEELVPSLRTIGIITDLSLAGTRVADAAPLARFTDLRALDLSNTQVAELAPLANLTNLESLNLSSTPVTDLAPLSNLPKLQLVYLTFNGICDASAGVALDEDRIIVGDDEKPWLSIYRLGGGASEGTIPLQPASAGDGAPEADLEGATVFDGRIVWISSNGRNKNGKVRPERFQLFASHRRGADQQQWLEAFSPPFGGLPEAIAATDEASYKPLRKSIGDLRKTDEDLAPKKNGFNIEGLSVSEDGKFLLIGLRNPQPGGKAILFRVDNAEELLDDRTSEVVLGPVVTLDLGGRGIRDIAWSPAHRAYVIAAGQVDDADAGSGFALFTWDGVGAPREIQAFRSVLNAHPQFHPEGVVPLLDRSAEQLVPSKRVLVLSDDGTKPLPGGISCKEASEQRKSFRAVIMKVE